MSRQDDVAGRPSVLCDFWYGQELTLNFKSLDEELKHRASLFRAAAKVALGRMFLLLMFGRKYDFVVPDWNRWGRMACVLQALMRRRSIVLLEVIDYADLDKSSLRSRLVLLMARYVLGPAMRQSVAAVQTMSQWEADRFHRMYGVELSRIAAIHWPLSYSPQRRSVPHVPHYVFASGRACCDWPTVINAARLGGWPLTIVCSDQDENQVRSLINDANIRLFVNLPRADHDALMTGAAVIAISLADRMTSAGQIRLGEAISAGIPVVATAVTGLRGYLLDGVTGISIVPGDAAQMAEAVGRLLADERVREPLIHKSQQHAKPLSRQSYFEAIAAMVMSVGQHGHVSGHDS